MIKISKTEYQTVCDACGFAYDDKWVKQIEIKTDRFEPNEYYLKPIKIKIHLCSNCIKELRKQSNKALYQQTKELREYNNYALRPIKKNNKL